MLIKEFKISGLQCDTPHCNYKNDTIQFEDYPKYINVKCPVCGSSLLTEQDYQRCVFMYAFVDKANKIANFFKWFNPMFYYRLITKKKEDETIYSERLPKRPRK